MNLPFFIARRYLFAKKSHNVINIISAISAIGMAIGTAALIIILSVYNGFDDIIKQSLGNIEPDILISPAEGKFFEPEGEAFDWAYKQASIMTMCSVLEENVYINYDGHNGIAKAKGVDRVFEEESPLSTKLIDGNFKLHRGDVCLAVVGAELAYDMGINPRFVSGIELYFPSADRQFSMSNPAASLDMVKVWPSGIFSIAEGAYNGMIVLPIEAMRDLLGLTTQVSGIELRMVPGTSKKEISRVIKELSNRVGEDLVVKDRYMQNETVYKMMKYEKAAIYLILVFVIIIIAFNIFGSLTMLIIEKEDDIKTIRSLGGTNKMIRNVFVLEGWMISLIGLVCGLVVGLALLFIQQKFGLIKMPGNFAIASYPVIIQLSDIILSTLCVATIGYLIALLPVGRLRLEPK